MRRSCYARRHNVWCGPGTALDDSSLLCFASDPAKTWRDWLYRQLGCIEGVLVKVTTSQASNALAQNVNRILFQGGHSF